MEKTKLRKVQFFLKPSQTASTSFSPKFQLNKVNFCKFEFGNALAILSKTGSKLAFWLSFLQYFYALIYFGDALTAIEVICKFWRVLLFSKADWTTSVLIGVPFVFFCIPCVHAQAWTVWIKWNKNGTNNCKVVKLLFSFSAWKSTSNLASSEGLLIFFALFRNTSKTCDKTTINTFKVVRVVLFLSPAAISATFIISLPLNWSKLIIFWKGSSSLLDWSNLV